MFWWIILLLVLAFLAYFWIKSDIFKRVQVSIVENPFGQAKKLTIYYKHVVGPYKNVGKYFDELYSILTKSVTTMGIYYNDPDVTKPEKCQCAIACIYSIGDQIQFDSKVVEKLIQHGYKKKIIPCFERAVHTRTKYNTVFCILRLIWFSFPAIKRFVKKNNIQVSLAMEINTIEPGNFFIDVYMPISDSSGYYVDEYEEAE
uniref:GyrI-like small molecule binding domain-containing protein n=1 Tax=Acrobeloides nanus TaxID=290746 RepID=A0A914CZK3_9BILA